MKKYLLLISGLLFSSSLALAGDWTGGDDLPTNPLPCSGPAPAGEAKPYDGGSPTGAPNRKGKTITVVDVPKLVGIGYFSATTKGILDAAAEMGI